MMKEIFSKNVEDTIRAGKDFAKALMPGSVVALIGDLGGGKTYFVKGIAEYFGIKEEIQSPTFTLIKEYNITKNKIKRLYHMDMYRLKNESEVTELGLEEIFGEHGSISIIEWADRIKNYLPATTKFVEFDFISENERKILIK